MLHSAVALSIILGFVSVELLGILPGGIVSAGYLAFFLEQPYRVLSTLVLAILTCGIVHLLQYVLIIYGRRRFMLAVLISIILSSIMENNLIYVTGIGQDLRVIGYIIPGLIANDMLKQGIFKTLLSLMIISLMIFLFIHSGVLLR